MDRLRPEEKSHVSRPTSRCFPGRGLSVKVLLALVTEGQHGDQLGPSNLVLDDVTGRPERNDELAS